MKIKNLSQASILRRRINHLRNAKKAAMRTLNTLIPEENICQRISDTFDEELWKSESELNEYEESIKNSGDSTLGTCTRIGKDFVMARVTLGWSQAVLAKEAGIGRGLIVEYEKHNYRQVTIERMIQIEGALMKGFTELELLHRPALDVHLFRQDECHP